jgi:hypothetical protein
MESKQDIQVVFSPQFLTVKPKFTHRRLNREIDPSASSWVFEPDQKLLLVNLEKAKHERWPSVFKDATNEPSETLTEEQIKQMASVLSHMTSDQEPATYQTATLIGEGTDAEIDSASASDMTYFSEIDSTGQPRSSLGPFEIVSQPMSSADQDNSLITRRDVDGLYMDSDWKHASLYPVRFLNEARMHV